MVERAINRVGVNAANASTMAIDLVLLIWGNDIDMKLRKLLDDITNIGLGSFYIKDTEARSLLLAVLLPIVNY